MGRNMRSVRMGRYILHKRVSNPLKFRRTMSGLENRALARFESEVTPPPHIY